MMTSDRVLLAAAACLVMAGCRATEFFVANTPSTFSNVERYLDIPYGDDPRQRLDIIAPRHGENLPVVVFWYGGSWIAGRKSEYRFVGDALAKLGIVTVLADYRLYPQVTFPGFDEDGAKAVAWVEQHVREYRGDPTHLVLMGHSAGAHTAAFLAFNHRFLRRFGADPKDIVGLIGLSGTYVLVPDTDLMRAAFPPPYSIKDWQPIQYVDSSAPSTLLLHGLADKEVSPQQAIELRNALERAHVPVQMHLYAHRGHGDTIASFAPVARWRTPSLNDSVKFIRSVTESSAPQPAGRGNPGRMNNVSVASLPADTDGLKVRLSQREQARS
jgi:acetyl esterase/lipase